MEGRTAGSIDVPTKMLEMNLGLINMDDSEGVLQKAGEATRQGRIRMVMGLYLELNTVL